MRKFLSFVSSHTILTLIGVCNAAPTLELDQIVINLATQLEAVMGEMNKLKESQATLENEMKLLRDELSDCCPTIVPSMSPSVTRTWVQLGSDIDGENPGDKLGSCVSLSEDGKIVAIGAELNDDNGISSGQVSVFKYNDVDAEWSQFGSDINGENANDYSGNSISLSEDGLTLAIGAYYNDGNGINSGHVRVYEYRSRGLDWYQLGSDIDGEDANDYSGSSVSLSGNGKSVAIGAYGHNFSDGHTRVFFYVESLSDWYQYGSDINGGYYDRSGWSVSLSDDGKTVAIGTPYPVYYNIALIGRTRVYEYRSDGRDWYQLGSDIDGENAGDYSGDSISLSSDGHTLAIGSRYGDRGDGGTGNWNVGTVRVYNYNEEDSEWSQIGADIDGENAYDESGGRESSVSLSDDGQTVAIGARYNDGNGTSSGHVRVYKYNDEESEWSQIGDDIDGENAGDQSGWSVSLSGDGVTVAIGATQNDVSGHVRVYKYMLSE